MATLKQLLEYAEQTFAGTTAVRSLRKIIAGLQANIDAVSGGGGQALIQFKDEGNNLGTTGTVTAVNFTGAAVTASRTGNEVTVDVTGGGGAAPRGIYARLRTESATTLLVGTSVTATLTYDITIDPTDLWIISSDDVCSAVVDVRRATVAAPTTFTSIAASAKPTLSADNYNTGAMTGWPTTLLAGEQIRFVVESASETQEVRVAIPGVG